MKAPESGGGRSPAPVLYLGDESLDTAASYLGTVMRRFDIAFDYVAPGETAAGLSDRRLFILSDYPAGSFQAGQMEQIADLVRGGAGLLMLGGWDSFQGSGGRYHGTAIEEALPVVMSGSDDRVNTAFPCLVWKGREHEILDGLPFDSPPCIGGYNRVAARPDAEVLLEVIRYRTSAGASSCVFSEEVRDVLLAVGRCGAGRTAAFASDAAPHWVGGFVDWGAGRVRGKIAGTEVEVGEHYAAFFGSLIRWTAGLRAD
jgi:hypothetical protein